MTGATIQLIRGPKVSDGEKKRQSNQCHEKVFLVEFSQDFC